MSSFTLTDTNTALCLWLSVSCVVTFVTAPYGATTDVRHDRYDVPIYDRPYTQLKTVDFEVPMASPSVISHFAEVLQTSLAPVFLLTGTAGFVNIYATRLGRIIDRLYKIANRGEHSRVERFRTFYLKRRVLLLGIAILLDVGIRAENLLLFFGGAIISLILSLTAFSVELLTAAHNRRRQLRKLRITAPRE